MTLLTWTEHNPSAGPVSYRGRRGGLIMFTIHWNGLTRGEDAKDWHLYTRLPGFKDDARWGSDSVDELKAKAEEIMQYWLSKVNLAPVEGT